VEAATKEERSLFEVQLDERDREVTSLAAMVRGLERDKYALQNDKMRLASGLHNLREDL
jgi:hypothetical protein